MLWTLRTLLLSLLWRAEAWSEPQALHTSCAFGPPILRKKEKKNILNRIFILSLYVITETFWKIRTENDMPLVRFSQTSRRYDSTITKSSWMLSNSKNLYLMWIYYRSIRMMLYYKLKEVDCIYQILFQKYFPKIKLSDKPKSKFPK